MICKYAPSASNYYDINLSEKDGGVEINNKIIDLSHTEFGLFYMCAFLIKKDLFRSRTVIDFQDFELCQFKKIKTRLKKYYWYTEILNRLDRFDQDDYRSNFSKLRKKIMPFLSADDQAKLIIPMFRRDAEDFYPVSKINIL